MTQSLGTTGLCHFASISRIEGTTKTLNLLSNLLKVIGRKVRGGIKHSSIVVAGKS